MSEIEKKKNHAVKSLISLCPRCERGEEHNCPIERIAAEVKSLRTIPIRVNDRIYSVIFAGGR